MKTPKIKLLKTDHGMDGWDATTILEARFSTEEKAVAWLEKRGFTHSRNGKVFYHKKESLRHTMGAISYSITLDEQVPEDPK